MADLKNNSTIYFAGGCFWGMEHLMRKIPGVTEVTSGYANGSGASDADYETVCTGKTGFRETVKVEYDPEETDLETLVYDYFYVVDPTVTNRQGNDIGTQYQTGIYYTDEKSRETVERIIIMEKSREKHFCVESGPLINFYPAEEYHQDYLKKNPGGYCHIPLKEMEILSEQKILPGKYRKPEDDVLKEKLTEMQYSVTRENETEPPFINEFWDTDEKGIYVDIATGEPLFSSKDKFESSCGWPAFSGPIEEPVIVKVEDNSFGMSRTEVRSRIGNSHLGHVFYGENEGPEGVRYCINSAALRFIPYEKMEEEGYGFLLNIFKQKDVSL